MLFGVKVLDLVLSFSCKVSCNSWSDKVHAADSFDFNEELLNKFTFIVVNFIIWYKFGIKEHRKFI